jgi:predicted lipoprotein
MLSKSFKFFVLFLTILVALSCKKNKKDDTDTTDVEDTPFDRKALLAQMADQSILPSYAGFKTKLDSMTNRSEDFTANPTLTTLANFRQAWVEAYIEWEKVELFEVGPAEFYALRSFMNIYPTSISGINSNIANSSANLEVPAAYPTQGFPALDYLLNGLAANDNDILIYYTSDPDAAAKRAYITRLINQMNTKFTTIHQEWTNGYREEFINDDGMDLQGSLPKIVNAYVLNYERYIRTGKFGLPSGAMAGGTPTPTLVEGLYKKNISRSLAFAAQKASHDFFNGKSVINGTEGPSLKTYLTALHATDSYTGGTLTEVINAQFHATNDKMNLLSENFNQEVQNNNQKMVDVFIEMQKLVRLLKVDMTSSLSITITYVDADGD